MLDRPSIGPLLRSLKRNYCKPENWATHWIFAWSDLTVVLPDGLTSPTNAARFLWEIHVYERHYFLFEQHLDDLGNVWLELSEIWILVFAYRCAKRNAAHS